MQLLHAALAVYRTIVQRTQTGSSNYFIYQTLYSCLLPSFLCLFIFE